MAIRLAALVISVLAGAVPSVAQDLSTGTVASPVVTIDQDRLFADSVWGKRAIAAIETASTALAAENRRIEADLTTEERALTDARATMEPVAFRAAADAFDAKVVEIRSEQDRKLRNLTLRRDAERKAFFKAILPILGQIMQDRDASVVLDARATLLASAATDVTADVIALADTSIGDGAGVVPATIADGTASQGDAPPPVSPGTGDGN